VEEICGPKREKVTGEWRKLHNEELHDLCCSSWYYIVVHFKQDEMGRACGTSRAGEACMILVGKPKGKKPLGRPRCRSGCNIKMDFKQMWCEGVGQFYVA
jgi:hypothetical protein